MGVGQIQTLHLMVLEGRPVTELVTQNTLVETEELVESMVVRVVVEGLLAHMVQEIMEVTHLVRVAGAVVLVTTVILVECVFKYCYQGILG